MALRTSPQKLGYLTCFFLFLSGLSFSFRRFQLYDSCKWEQQSSAADFTLGNKEAESTYFASQSNFATYEGVQPYKQGKIVVYEPLTNCSHAEFLGSYRNPCWRSTSSRGKVACAATIVLLGFHKSGTTDLSRWFRSHTRLAFSIGDYFDDSGLTEKCPLEWLAHFRNRQIYLKHSNQVAFNDCPGCVVVNRIVKENATHLVRQSAIQYLRYTMTDNSRYIITMREPGDRMISHFFYAHKLQRAENPYRRMSLAKVGNDFFHKIVSEQLSALLTCLKEHGTAVCLLQKGISPVDLPHPYLSGMILQSCYVVHLKEVFKFIPKSRIYFSKLEEYSSNEARSMKSIYDFVGVSTDGPNNPFKSLQKSKLNNKGYSSKPVLQKTKDLLKNFYMPCNVELAALMYDDKWLWK